MKSISGRERAIFESVVISLILVLSVAFFPETARAQEDPLAEIGQMAEKFKDEMLEAAKASGGEVARRLEAIEDLLSLVEGNDEWTEALWNQAVRIAEQSGIAVDELFPSVSGCITDEAGEPVYGALIAVLPTTFDIAVPTYAITGTGTLESGSGNPSTFGFGLTGPTIPVSESFVPTSYRQTFNRGGCYWVPLSPGVINTLGNLISMPDLSNTNDNTGTIDKTLTATSVKIIPIRFGYTIDPIGKVVQFNTDGSFLTLKLETLGGYGNLGSIERDTSR